MIVVHMENPQPAEYHDKKFDTAVPHENYMRTVPERFAFPPLPLSMVTHVIFVCVCVRLLSWYNCAKQYSIAENDSIALTYQSVVRCST